MNPSIFVSRTHRAEVIDRAHMVLEWPSFHAHMAPGANVF